MPDIATIAAALSSIKTATDLAKYISDSGVSLAQAEVKLKFADLVLALASAKLEIAEVQNTILAKDEEIQLLKNQLQTADEMTFENGVYWSVAGDERDGPFCQRCYDADRAVVRLQYHESTLYNNTSRSWSCTACRTTYSA